MDTKIMTTKDAKKLNDALIIPIAPAETLLPNSFIRLVENSDNVDYNSPKLTSYLEDKSVKNVEKLLINNKVCSYKSGITRIINKINKPNDNKLTIKTDNHFGNPFPINFFKNGYKA